MSMVEKKKHLFVVTLDNGKKTYFDFVGHNIYGVSGKVVQNFNTEAKRILKSKEDDNFLAMYFYERTLTWPCRDTLKRWPISLVETIYSLYGNRYSVKVLSGIAEFCYKKNFKLERKIIEISYSYLPAVVIPFISHADTNEMRNYIVEDAKKIAFRYEHENWDYLDVEHYGDMHVYRCVYRYIQLCNLLHHERTYKNLYQSICMMEKEKSLMDDKLCLEYQKNAPLFFEDENFTILIPTTADEFKKEADYQQNCVFRLYCPRVKDCSTHVVFIRKKSDIDTPYITCEVSNCGNIIQYLTRFNCYVTDDDALAFKVAYQEFLHEHF